MYKRKSKYNNVKAYVDGIKFDSKLEAKRFLVLRDMEQKGEIQFLVLQPKFELQGNFKHEGKTIRAINYVADFMYTKENKKIVEDAKGMETDVYKIKRKLFLKEYGEKFIFREVRK